VERVPSQEPALGSQVPGIGDVLARRHAAFMS
jgi:hypothetical protein